MCPQRPRKALNLVRVLEATLKDTHVAATSVRLSYGI
jgi:hypothetical protein